jgi:hypothetical protein
MAEIVTGFSPLAQRLGSLSMPAGLLTEVCVFRLIKLALMLAFGFAIYEFYQGLTREPQSRRQGGSRGGRQGSDRSVRKGVGTMTGPGEGQRVQTEDASGAGGSHVVGRGVVR